MVHDIDIMGVDLATEEEVVAFESGEGESPSINPLRPFFGAKYKHSAWNITLRENFLDLFEETYEVELTEDKKDIIGELYDNRIDRLRRIWRQRLMTLEEDLERKLKNAEELGRRNRRRVNVSLLNAIWER